MLGVEEICIDSMPRYTAKRYLHQTFLQGGDALARGSQRPMKGGRS